MSPSSERPSDRAGRSNASIILLFLLALVLLLPTLSKPFHIDDPVVLEVSRQIVADPFNPFGGWIDWTGELQPLWRVTTNPPLLSYYLAPFLMLCGYWEPGLHLWLLPVLLLLVVSVWELAKRFCGEPWIPTLLVLLSPAVVVSVNLMRDVPAAALATAAVALVLAAVDRPRVSRGLGGGLMLGAAILTKYSAAAMLPVLLWYCWRQRQPKQALLLLGGSLSPLLLWMLWTRILYGASHPVFLLMSREAGGTVGVLDKTLGGLAIVGATQLAAPIFIWASRRRLGVLGLSLGLALLAGVTALWHYGGGFQFAFWVACGTVVLVQILGWSSDEFREEQLLRVWVLAVVLFAILIVPFQAVRHLIPALVPIGLLAARRLDSQPATTAVLWGVLLLQVNLTGAVAYADYAYADTYRKAARRLRETIRPGSTVWFVGHWGWKFYAQRAGMRQLHGNGPGPVPGDWLVWPRRVHIGNVFDGHPSLRQRLRLQDEFSYDLALPVRTMNFQSAAFYAVIRGNAPFAFQTLSLESFRVYRVGQED